jgi:hypothetical protein
MAFRRSDEKWTIVATNGAVAPTCSIRYTIADSDDPRTIRRGSLTVTLPEGLRAQLSDLADLAMKQEKLM